MLSVSCPGTCSITFQKVWLDHAMRWKQCVSSAQLAQSHRDRLLCPPLPSLLQCLILENLDVILSFQRKRLLWKKERQGAYHIIIVQAFCFHNCQMPWIWLYLLHDTVENERQLCNVPVFGKMWSRWRLAPLPVWIERLKDANRPDNPLSTQYTLIFRLLSILSCLFWVNLGRVLFFFLFFPFFLINPFFENLE